ncbi:hypothetical protein K450DRAFT_241272 [Umbelopsis ramanniana AG]|uniref:Uncharacterized protein n=1 Tax=Umbelopsis ramanniana AG TaxID=1314678 RepID=A0AAD5EAU4_UMBRA|nr:uncharacterized protein K450DRAFT_241272 [Umbelopsis ramanniana AG]KAI8579500.1 hypothetical protein K450DRAFT_241272 [Umbelopsis ramanniana AG]
MSLSKSLLFLTPSLSFPHHPVTLLLASVGNLTLACTYLPPDWTPGMSKRAVVNP